MAFFQQISGNAKKKKNNFIEMQIVTFFMFDPYV